MGDICRYWVILGIGQYAVPDAVFVVTQMAAGAAQWISISYVGGGGGAADGGMRVDGTQHA